MLFLALLADMVVKVLSDEYASTDRLEALFVCRKEDRQNPAD
jgi:hypothetical protein